MSAQAVPTARKTLARIEKGLRLVTVPMPHLAGLAAAVRVDIDDRVPTMGVFASGRMVANRAFVAKLKESELVFVLAHELLHLALRTHDRARGSGRLEFNYAHDYIINDILRAELGFAYVPAGGLDMPGAKEKSAEQIVLQMRRDGKNRPSKTQVWDGAAASADPAAGGQGEKGDGGDVLSEQRERELFPDCENEQASRAKEMQKAAARAAALAKAIGAMKGRGQESGAEIQAVEALRGIYRTPWQSALQKWLESMAPGERTFTRPSRRESGQSDIVLPGRKRESWMLNVILDTSGSMADEIPRALGAIADFCDMSGVDDIRLIQCDAAITSDEVLSPRELSEFQVAGFGGSDLSPAMHALGEDARVTAAVIVTDGDIVFPQAEMPYSVLWVVPAAHAGFRPPYGRVIAMGEQP